MEINHFLKTGSGLHSDIITLLNQQIPANRKCLREGVSRYPAPRFTRITISSFRCGMFPIKKNKPFNPIDVILLGSHRLMLEAQHGAHLIK